VPAVPGLADVPYLTNETLFANRTLPSHLVVIGGGPVGLEMAQAHRRLGAAVTVLEAGEILARDDRECAAIVAARLRGEGVAIEEGVRLARVARDGDGIDVRLEDGRRLAASHLLVAAGRTPTVDGLGLEVAGIRHDARGIAVDDSLRTSNRRVWAIGDCNGRHAFTHMAAHEASLFVRGALFRLPARLDADRVPWCTYADPELAQVGLTEQAARARGLDGLQVLRWPMADNDRARTERRTEGLVKIVADRRGRVLGASIVAPQAGELIQPWCLALQAGLKLSALAGAVPPYPTLGEAGKRAAAAFYAPRLFGPLARTGVRWLSRLPIW
jgi:pyruvate/2-oxoglutarate dehydrogenase complex dihydrolipoamide dehydrogenase (E3) component